MMITTAPLFATTPAPAALKRPASVLVVIGTTAGEYLLLRRVNPNHFWQSVTGSLQPGESPRHAAVREVHEETGLRVAPYLVALQQSRLFPIVPAWRGRYASQHHFNREYWFAVCLPQRRIIRLNPAEHTAYQWFHWQRAVTVVSSWTNRVALHWQPLSCTR